jgi:hypothetical protein
MLCLYLQQCMREAIGLLFCKLVSCLGVFGSAMGLAAGSCCQGTNNQRSQVSLRAASSHDSSSEHAKCLRGSALPHRRGSASVVR